MKMNRPTTDKRKPKVSFTSFLLKEKLNKLFNLIVIKNLVFYNIIAAYFDISMKKKVGVKREGLKRQKEMIKKTKGKD